MSKEISPDILDQDEDGAVGTMMQWNIAQPFEEGSNAICSNMDRSRDGHPGWSKSEKEKVSQRRRK